MNDTAPFCLGSGLNTSPFRVRAILKRSRRHQYLFPCRSEDDIIVKLACHGSGETKDDETTDETLLAVLLEYCTDGLYVMIPKKGVSPSLMNHICFDHVLVNYYIESRIKMIMLIYLVTNIRKR